MFAKRFLKVSACFPPNLDPIGAQSVSLDELMAVQTLTCRLMSSLWLRVALSLTELTYPISLHSSSAFRTYLLSMYLRLLISQVSL